MWSDTDGHASGGDGTAAAAGGNRSSIGLGDAIGGDAIGGDVIGGDASLDASASASASESASALSNRHSLTMVTSAGEAPNQSGSVKVAPLEGKERCGVSSKKFLKSAKPNPFGFPVSPLAFLLLSCVAPPPLLARYRLCCTFPLDFRLLSVGFPVLARFPVGFPLASLWLSFGFASAFRWLFFGVASSLPLAVRWLSLAGGGLGISCPPRDVEFCGL